MNDELRETILHLSHNHPRKSMQRVARIVLLYDQGLPTREVARQTGISRSRARYWHRQFSLCGVALFTKHDHDKTLADMQVSVLSSNGVAYQVEDQTAEVETTLPTIQINPLSTARSDKQPFAEQHDLFNLAELAKVVHPGILPSDQLSEAGRKVLRFHFIQMLIHEQGTLTGENIEELHDMRVATRRMRAAFEVFSNAFQPKVIKPYLNGLRATGRSLGRVRDMDVFIEKAQYYITTQLGGLRETLLPLTSAWEEQRELNRKKMVEHLDSEEYRKFKVGFNTFLETPGAGALKKKDAEPVPNLVRDIAPILIYDRLAVVRAFDPLIENASLKQLHALRIDFKKLRYTLEFFAEVLGDQVEEIIDELKRIQDHLGSLNDAQVATQILRDFLVEWDAKQEGLPLAERKSPDPLIDFLSAKYRERQDLMLAFRPIWIEFTRPELRQKIARAVSVL